MGDLKNRTRRNITLTKEHNNWLNDYSSKTGIPTTKILERFINDGINNINDIHIIAGRMTGSERKGTEFLWEHWLWLENYYSRTGLKPSKVLNAFIKYGIEKINNGEV
jgi:predicted DNA-binding protein